MGIKKRTEKNIPLSVNRLEGCPMEWVEPEVVELSKEPDAEGACEAGSVAVGSAPGVSCMEGVFPI